MVGYVRKPLPYKGADMDFSLGFLVGGAKPLFERLNLHCPFRKSYPNVFVMQPSQDRNGDNDAGPLDYSMQGRIFL